MSIETAQTIDVHAHAVLEETMQAAGDHGPELTHEEPPTFRVADYELQGVRYRGSPFMDPALRLAAMDRSGIDYQVLSPNPLSYFHFVAPDVAMAFCQTHNNTLAKISGQHNQRLGSFAAVPMQHIPSAIAETRRAVTELGMFGPYIGTDFGMALDDPALDDFYATLTALNVPLCIHPAPAGIDGPKGDPNLGRFDLDIIIGFAAQETIAVCTLIYGGVLERHPDLDIYISHGGGATGYLFGRMAMAAQKRPWASDALRKEGAFEALLQRLWFDVHVHSEDSATQLARHVNPERLLFGTNFAGWDQQQGDVRAAARPYANNARRLLRRMQNDSA